MKKTIVFLTVSVTIFAISCNQPKKESQNEDKVSKVYARDNNVESADEALQLLKEGNKRFVIDQPLPDDISTNKKKDLKDKGQKPFAVIVTCSDSRVPPELIFDQGLGDLFVIRVAGNVIDSIEMGSIQYAVEHLESPLVVVLGHENCGAVKATIAGGEIPGSIPSISCRILPSVLKAKSVSDNEDNLADRVTDANVEAAVEILEKDPLLEHLIESGKIKVIGAKYLLETGTVTYFQ
ncbi:MAG: carbonic anhydrase [Salinivirgaceae bacterium]|jgi:carbonic anhydrase